MDAKNQSPSSNSSPTKQIFILAGQSNMAGRGGASQKNHHWDGFVPAGSQPHPSILRLNAKLQWEEAHEPLHADIDTKKVCGVGPGMSFANAVKERMGTVGLVPCAVGGTAIKEWARGQHLYENMVRRAKDSVKGGGKIIALLWYQGESDALTQNDADAYQRNMELLINNVRSDLGLPSLPVIQVAIDPGAGKYAESVREAQKRIKMENVVCVDAKGLALEGDHLHLTSNAQAQLGHSLANAFLANFASPIRSSTSVCSFYLAVVFSFFAFFGGISFFFGGFKRIH